MAEYHPQWIQDYFTTTAMSFGEMRRDMEAGMTKVIEDYAATIEAKDTDA